VREDCWLVGWLFRFRFLC